MLTDVECAGSVIVQESLLAECGMEVGHGGGLVHRHSSGGGSTDGIACVNLLVRCGDGVAFAHCGEIVGDYSQIRALLRNNLSVRRKPFAWWIFLCCFFQRTAAPRIRMLWLSAACILRSTGIRSLVEIPSFLTATLTGHCTDKRSLCIRVVYSPLTSSAV